MNTLEIKQLAEAIVNCSWVTLLAYIVLAMICGVSAFFGSYLRKKGKNIATKKDIAEITKKIEDVRIEYVSKIETLKGVFQLHSVVLARQLEAHQQVFSAWYEMVYSGNADNIGHVCQNCRDVLMKNRIYLRSKTSDAIAHAIIAASKHNDYQEPCVWDKKKIEANWNLMRAAGDVILKAVDLPPLLQNFLKNEPPKEPN